MRRIFFLMAVALAAGSLAINLNQYLYDDTERFGYQDISVGGTAYQIISVNGVQTFLYNRDDDQLVTDADQISSIMREYYIETYMVKESDMDEILGYVDAFDASRNDGERRAGVEEYACRDLLAVGLKGKFTNDPEANLHLVTSNIDRIAIYIANDWLGGGEYSDPSRLKPELVKFFNSTFMIDKDLKDIRHDLEHDRMTEENAYDRILDAEEKLEDIYGLETNLETTIFRSPKTYAECKNCLGICYYVEMNRSALDKAKELMDDRLEEVSKIEHVENIGGEIAERTAERMGFVKKNNEKLYYTTRITSLQSYWNMVKTGMNESMKLVSDPYIIETMGQINANLSGMQAAADSLSFDGMDRRYNDTKASIEGLKARSAENVELFDRLVNASAQADVVAILSKNATLISEKEGLDALFTKPVRYDVAMELLEKYGMVSSAVALPENMTADALLSDDDRNAVLVAKVINGFYSPLTMVDRGLLKPYDGYLVMAAPIVIGISLCSLVGFFGLGSYGSISGAGYNRRKAMIYTMAPALMVMLGVFTASLTMYLFTPSVGESSGPMMFMEYAKDKPVFIIMRTVDESGAMAKCGRSLQDAMEAKGITVYRAFDRGGTCVIDRKEQAGGCTGILKDASIVMHEGGNSVTSDIFIRPVLDISGDRDEFTKCTIEKIYANSG